MNMIDREEYLSLQEDFKIIENLLHEAQRDAQKWKREALELRRENERLVKETHTLAEKVDEQKKETHMWERNCGALQRQIERLENGKAAAEELCRRGDDVILNLVDNCLASDFNEHWECFQAAQIHLTNKGL